MLLIAGCRSAPPTPQEQQATALKALHSDRLKRSETAGVSALIIDPDGSLDADGMWIPEPDDKAHALAYPEQAHIICDVGAEYCIEMKISFIVIGGFLSVKEPEETLWPIKTWDKRSLLAEYGPFTQFQPGTGEVPEHVLSMVFASDTVTSQTFPHIARAARNLRKRTPTDWQTDGTTWTYLPTTTPYGHDALQIMQPHFADTRLRVVGFALPSMPCTPRHLPVQIALHCSAP